MNYTVSPSADDLEALSAAVWDGLPDELVSRCQELVISIEDMADDAMQDNAGVSDPFDLLAVYKSGKEISPGVERKIANDDDIFILYRRPLLDMWCETGDDLQTLIKIVFIDELGRYLDFSDDEIQEMSNRDY